MAETGPARECADATKSDASIGLLRLGRNKRAIDAVPLQRIADLKAFRLVREGSDLKAVKGSETADIDLFDLGRLASEPGIGARHLLLQRLRLAFRAAGGELQLEAASAASGRRSWRRRRGGLVGLGGLGEPAAPPALARACARYHRVASLRLSAPSGARRGRRAARRRRRAARHHGIGGLLRLSAPSRARRGR